VSDIESLPPLREIIQQYNLSARKSLGQNFLLDMNLTDKIAGVAGDIEGLTIFEIGPGPGGLTRSLLKSCPERVIAIEFDSRAVEALSSLREASGGRLDILEEDAMEADLLSVAPDCKRAIVANLPYNVATPLLIGWLKQIREHPGAFESMTLMFQKEVADRINSDINSRAYGRLSVMSQWLCNVRCAFNISPSAFTPPPKVKSTVVSFIPRKLAEGSPLFSSMEKVTSLAFAQRRKMLRSSMKKYRDLLEECGIDQTLRAENVPVKDFVRIAEKIESST
jgi:16S rRNA (adenine1518-N6/adenine1519-N6)-dimethyltransferase